jgi:Domain of unknown function (DUF4326)
MIGTIRVANLTNKGANGAVYIGRAWRGVAGSPLGNPRVVGSRCPDGGTWTAGATLPHYERELRQALDRKQVSAVWGGRQLLPQQRAAMRTVMNDLFSRVAAGEDVVVDCHCKERTDPGEELPVDPAPCHGDIVAKLVMEKLQQRGVV